MESIQHTEWVWWIPVCSTCPLISVVYQLEDFIRHERLGVVCVSSIMCHGVQWSDPNTQSGYGSVPRFVAVFCFGLVSESVRLYYNETCLPASCTHVSSSESLSKSWWDARKEHLMQ